MENLDNTHQIPESDNNQFQEENSSPVQETEIVTKMTTSTESGQTETEPADEFHETQSEPKVEPVEDTAEEEIIPGEQNPDIHSELK
jgi:hypothetical protein